jgi:hypothetical protein
VRRADAVRRLTKETVDHATPPRKLRLSRLDPTYEIENYNGFGYSWKKPD